jgi:DNA-binding NarL/FixJ family response regulator
MGDSVAVKEEVTHENANREPLRVVLVDGNEIVSTGIQAVLAKHGDRVRLVGHVISDDAAGEVLRDVRPDVVLMPLCGERGHSVLTLASDVEQKHSVPVLVLSETSDERLVYEALRLGVTGYLLNSAGGAQLAEALAQVSKGATVLDPILATRAVLSAAQASDLGGWSGAQLRLTRRECDVLRLLADGLSNRRIADELSLGDETVKTHLRSIYKKLGVQDRTQAVALALRQGLFPS